ncbi:MAG: DNA polymerase I, partial [Nevskiales bacterium]|nr:DNA polymerase I [Nevskiales bacterium]
MSKPLILIDGSSWLYRAFHALPPLNNARGEPTGAVFGMASMLKRLLKDYAPDRIAVVFDPPGPTFRNDLYAEYKANREETPEDLSRQFPVVRELIEALGLPVLQVERTEADDVIATLAKQAQRENLPVLIVTGDKDMAQLVNVEIKLLDTLKNRVLDAAAVREKFGVPPERIVDYLALVGDASDNIPGVPLVGPKTAAKWLAEHGSLDAVVAKAAEVKGKAGENLRASLKQIPLARELVTLRCDLKLPVNADDLKPRDADTQKLVTLYRRLGFNRWLAELENGPRDGQPGGAHAPGESERPEPAASPATRAETVLDEAAFAALLRRLKEADLVCLDTETDSLDAQQANLVGLSFAVEPGHG